MSCVSRAPAGIYNPPQRAAAQTMRQSAAPRGWKRRDGKCFFFGALKNQMAAAAVCVAEARCSRLEPGRGFHRSAGASAHSAGQGAPVFFGACPSARQPPMHCILVAAPRTLKSRGGILRRCFPVVRRGRRRRRSRRRWRPVCVHFGTVFGSHLRGPRGAVRW